MATIIVVDDSISILKMVQSTAEYIGHRVITAQDGEQGLLAAKSNRADLVIADINMPVMDGISLVEELRKLPNYSHVPILMMTTESKDEKKEQGKAAGATGWLAKPVSQERLIKAMSKLLD